MKVVSIPTISTITAIYWFKGDVGISLRARLAGVKTNLQRWDTIFENNFMSASIAGIAGFTSMYPAPIRLPEGFARWASMIMGHEGRA